MHHKFGLGLKLLQSRYTIMQLSGKNMYDLVILRYRNSPKNAVLYKRVQKTHRITLTRTYKTEQICRNNLRSKYVLCL